MARRPLGAAIVAVAVSLSPRTLAAAGDTGWMLRAKCGISLHCQHRILLGYSHGRAALGTKAKFTPASEMIVEGWNRFVDGFDARTAEGQSDARPREPRGG